ncbi:hypothetical protein LEMLEM_LOCUS13396, partial [Lemmus lemmus]
ILAPSHLERTPSPSTYDDRGGTPRARCPRTRVGHEAPTRALARTHVPKRERRSLRPGDSRRARSLTLAWWRYSSKARVQCTQESRKFMVSEARPGPARLALPLRLGLRGSPLSCAPWRAPVPSGTEARAGAWGARAAGALSAHTVASPVHEPGSREPSAHCGPLSSSLSSSSLFSGPGFSRPELALLLAPIGLPPPAQTTATPEREEPRSWTKSFSAIPRAPTPSTLPPGAGFGSCSQLAAASTVGSPPARSALSLTGLSLPRLLLGALGYLFPLLISKIRSDLRE